MITMMNGVIAMVILSNCVFRSEDPLLVFVDPIVRLAVWGLCEAFLLFVIESRLHQDQNHQDYYVTQYLRRMPRGIDRPRMRPRLDDEPEEVLEPAPTEEMLEER